MAVKKRRKKMLLSVTAVVSLAALGAGIWFGTRSGSEPVNVYSFQYIGMTEFWGDAQESYGPVTTDRIQTEFLSDTQTVTEVKVKDGDQVKKGDVLFTFDTTLDALSLERKRLEVEKIKVQIDAAGARLQDTREMVPYEPPKPTEPEEADLGKELEKAYAISPRVGENKKAYDGKSKETAIICWLKDGNSITDAILEELFQTATQYQAETPPVPEPDQEEKPESSASDEPETVSDGQEKTDGQDETPEQTYKVDGFFTCNGETVKPDNLTVGAKDYLIRDTYRYNGKTYWLESVIRKKDGAEIKDCIIEAYPQTEDEQTEWKEQWGEGVEVRYMRDISVAGQQMLDGRFAVMEADAAVQLEVGKDAVLMFQPQIGNPPENLKLQFAVTPADGILQAAFDKDLLILSGKPEELTTQPVDYSVTAKYSFYDNHDVECAIEETFRFSVSVVSQPREKTGEFYVVFKTTEKNYLKGVRTLWQGAKVTAYEDGTFDMLLYNPSDVPGFTDHTIKPEPEIEIDLPEINPNEMYTAEQILDMQKQCYAIIKEQNEKLKLAESEYQIMERELGDGNIYSEIDGKVVALLTEEEARERKEPLLKVSGGGGFYIEGSVSELEKEKLKIGQEVTVNDWQSGGTYTGEVVSIGDFPSDSDNWNGMGNPTASYYPFKAFVGEEADLQAGSYVSMTYSTASAEQGIYLEKPFVRTEKGNSYIYVRGADGRLEKRNVKVGKALWGSYYEILSPLGEEDFLAFPYGKNVKTGAPTVESDLSALYGF